jgi:translation elongation factor EF-1beta
MVARDHEVIGLEALSLNVMHHLLERISSGDAAQQDVRSAEQVQVCELEDLNHVD